MPSHAPQRRSVSIVNSKVDCKKIEKSMDDEHSLYVRGPTSNARYIAD